MLRGGAIGGDGNGVEGATGAQVTTDQAAHPRMAGGHGLGDVLVVEAMESIAPQPLVAPGQGDGIGEGRLRQVAVKCRVKAGPLLQLPGLQPADHRKGRPVVQRRQGYQLGKGNLGFGREPGRGGEARPAMHQAMHHQRGAGLGPL
jgi:hypothetical protein